MDDTANLSLPYIAAAQAQKHVTHNEAIRALDAIVQIGVLDDDRTVPPSSPSEGDRHIVAAGASGLWAGKAGSIAAWQDGAWAFYAPRAGWLAWRRSDDTLLAFDGAAWGNAGGASAINPIDGGLVGINSTADSTNRLAVAAPATLFNHDGAGHHLKINKAADTETAAALFQTGFSGRAEIGLAGDDDLHVKVSADGSAWHEAIVIDRTTGACAFPNTTIGGGGGGGATDYVRTRAVAIQDVFAMADTWNDAASTFKGIALDVTDTASAAGSKLIHLLVGGTSRFSVGKAGDVTIGLAGAGVAPLTINGYEKTSAAHPPLVTYQGTWNFSPSSTPGPLVKFDVTDTQSHGRSSLMDFYINGTRRIEFRKDGNWYNYNPANANQFVGLRRLFAMTMGVFAGKLGTGEDADIIRLYWENNTTGNAAVIQGMGANRLSIQSLGAIVQISDANRWEYEGTNTSTRLVVSGYIKATSIGRPIEFGNSGQTVGQEAVPLYVRTYVAGKDLIHFRDPSDAIVAKIEEDGSFFGKLKTTTVAAAETITPTHTLTLYDANGTAYKVPAALAALA